MFKENKEHKRVDLFDFYSQFLSIKVQDRLSQSWSQKFYDEIFCNINEEIFKQAYSKQFSRPNFPINILVSLYILKMKFNLTDEELFDEYQYSIQFRHALGLHDFDEYPLVDRTYYNFKKRMVEYEEKEDINLFEKLFSSINEKILKNME